MGRGKEAGAQARWRAGVAGVDERGSEGERSRGARGRRACARDLRGLPARSGGPGRETPGAAARARRSARGFLVCVLRHAGRRASLRERNFLPLGLT